MEAARRSIKHRIRSFARWCGRHSVQPKRPARDHERSSEARIAQHMVEQSVQRALGWNET
jgi:hypothetical protein